MGYRYTKEQLIALARERGMHPPEDATDDELRRVERRLSAERRWICEPQPARHGVEEWAAHHRGQGHNPYPAPTRENPERWDCDDCNHIWRTLTPEQVRQKFAHLRTTVDQAIPALGDRPSRRETVIDAALDMADRLVTTQYEFRRSVVRSADRTLRKPDDAKE